MNINYPQLFADHFLNLSENGKNFTRSNKILMPMHGAIAQQVEEHGFITNSLCTGSGKEELIIGPYGRKRVDIAIHNKENDNLEGVILYKGIRNSYNKNANNLIEILRGESSLLLDMGIPVYQIILIPTVIKMGEEYEVPSTTSSKNYANFINFCRTNDYWGNLKIGVYYIDVDYKNYTGSYSSARKIKGVENTLNEGITNFMETLTDAKG